jgi:hypothetical protein
MNRLIAVVSMALGFGGMSVVYGEGGIIAPNITVGRNLRTYSTIKLAQRTPTEGLQLTLTSDDPARLLLSSGVDKPGSPSIVLKVYPRLSESPEFWVNGLAAGGTATYTVTGPGVGSAKGTVTLAPSGIVIVGPFKTPKFKATPHGDRSKIMIVSVALDSSLKFSEEQQVAFGSDVEVTIANSNPEAGKLGNAKLVLAGGTSSAATYFQPAAEGEATLSPVPPPGFTTPSQWANVVAAVEKPGLAIVGEVYLGKDLQISAAVCLGEAAPPGGLKVTLKSEDGSRLALSEREDKIGSGSITVTVPAGKLTAPYYLQGLGDSGIVNYSAEAEGFRSRSARVGLTPSGIIVAYEKYGPPDEANVLRNGGTNDEREFFVSVAKAKERPVHVVVWTAHLFPESGRAADMTVQPLRPGVNVTVNLSTSSPAVGTVESPLVLKPGTDHVVSRFTPLTKGTTVISVDTPRGFATPKNATSVPARVSEE